MTFKEYLTERFKKVFPTAVDDDVEHWLSELDVDTLIGYGELYGAQQFIKGKEERL